MARSYAWSLRQAGFTSSYADPDVWTKPNVKADGFKYLEYVLVYVDEKQVILHNPKIIREYLASWYTLKDNSVKEPDEYLGAQIRKYDLPGTEDSTCWSMSCDRYVIREVAGVQRKLPNSNLALNNKVSTPLSTGYRAAIDVSPELDANPANYFQYLIEVLWWIIELGSVDILTPVTMLSLFSAAPRQGHLEQVLHVFAYLKAHDRSS